MINSRIPIRLRLTLWYVLLLGITFAAFAFYLINRFEHSLKNTIDSSLEITVSKTISAFDEEDFYETNQLSFENRQTELFTPDFSMRLLSVDGEVWDTYGLAEEIPTWGKAEAGYSSQKGTDGEGEWRIYSQPIFDSKGNMIGWVQAARSIESVIDVVEGLRDQLLLGIPLLLFFAGLGGYFLSSRAFLPIEKITKTAREITLHNLSRKIDYEGSLDEVGRLAQTFDEMLERLQSAFEHEKRFTSDAAHELRTPLTVLKGQIEVTLNRPRNTSEYKKKLEELLLQVDRLIRLSNALLFLSRSDQNQIPFTPSLVNLNELIEVLVEQFNPLANAKSIKINTNISSPIFLNGDNDLLIRLFMNIFENAVKYSPEGGEITVTALKVNKQAEIKIHNSGAGISQEHLLHLFERFYRVDTHRSNESGGSGLGLAIAQEIVNRHAGEIEAQSSLNQGVVIFVRLPLSNS